MYDEFGNVISTTGNGAVRCNYNEYGLLTGKEYSNSVNHAYSYTYKDNAAKELESISVLGCDFKPLKDVNGRNTGKEIYSGENKVAGEYITYRKIGDRATNMPATIWYATGNKINESIKYTYDRCGNISEIRENGHLKTKYTYDSLNRLIREDNKYCGTTFVFSYDLNGNITERCEYPYTLKRGEELEELECTHYTYDYEGDKLKAYNNETFAYNALGNPTMYRGKTANWLYGKLLANYNGVTFSYNGAGQRVSKGNITFTYDSDGKLIKQSNGLEFIYDASGVAGVLYNGGKYIYRKDAQGNVVALLNADGEVAVRYEYDAWGNHVVTDKNGNPVTSGIGELNPFRYRSYYYDTETELYYLQTRYYDPELGRFISQDSIEYAAPETINGLNLYAYCGNNPVMYVDPTGNAWWEFWKWNWKAIGAIVGTVAATVGAIALTAVTFGVAGALAIGITGFAIGVAGSLISQSIAGEGINIGKVFFDGAWGIIGISMAASGIGALGSVILGGLVGAGQSFASDMIFNGGQVNYKNLMYSTIGGAVGGLFAGAGAKSTIQAVQSAKQILSRTIANGSKNFIGRASSILARNSYKLLLSFGLYLYGVVVGQSIVLGGTT